MKNIALFENTDKPEASRYAEISARKLIELGSEVIVQKRLADQFPSDLASKVKVVDISDYEKYADSVISFGGDGTMLSIARCLINSNVPIMGFNVGKLGFLAEYSVNDIDLYLKNLIDGNYRIVDRFVLESVVEGETLYALNDFVIEKKNSSRMITVSTFANNHLIADYRADGLIITTPTGSTAYSLSCNGPIIAPSTRVICLTPISPHSLNLRPVVIPDSKSIRCKISSPTGEVNFVADGQIIRIVKNENDIHIKRSEAIIKLIKPTNSSYYDLLRKKLLWAANTMDDCTENKEQGNN
jgi:NAD+ kinase